jgi:hypothetical protein
MPLLKGKSRGVMSHNYKVERAAGKPKRQAIAIMLNKAGVKKAKKKKRR